MKLKFFILDEAGEPKRVRSSLEWMEWFEHSERRVVAHTKLDGELDGVSISTIFLGFMHNGGMWETMIFGGPHQDRMWRYKTRRQALKGHAKAVEYAKNGKEPG